MRIPNPITPSLELLSDAVSKNCSHQHTFSSSLRRLELVKYMAVAIQNLEHLYSIHYRTCSWDWLLRGHLVIVTILKVRMCRCQEPVGPDSLWFYWPRITGFNPWFSILNSDHNQNRCCLPVEANQALAVSLATVQLFLHLGFSNVNTHLDFLIFTIDIIPIPESDE